MIIRANLLAFLFAILFRPFFSLLLHHPPCRILPTDEAWPEQHVWDAFNDSVDGRLIKVVPDGSPCHDPNYDKEKCDVVRKSWFHSEFHLERPGSLMNPVFYNLSCDPFTPREAPCGMRNLVEYSVNVSRPEHVVRTVQFAKEHNIRFVIKNTGHDYMGKSTGTGALSVWMHNLKDVAWYPNYTSADYNGPAVKAPAGVLGIELATAASSRGYAVVSGECPTVGLAGGYTQGGGHSILGPMYGLAADQTLEFEVVTMKGEHIVASPTQNEDLFWALSGGGGGTYAVVLSVTIKIYPDVPLSLASLEFSSIGISPETYWQAVTAYHASTPNMTDSQLFVLASYTNSSFLLNPIVAVNKTQDELTTIVRPLLDSFDELGIKYNFSAQLYPRYLDALGNLGATVPSDVGILLIGTRLLPRSLWKDQNGFASVVDAAKQVTDGGVLLTELSMKLPNQAVGKSQRAVLPAWREAGRFAVISLPFSANQTREEVDLSLRRISESTSILRKISPGSGTYLNEADLFEPDFKDAFYGSNYDRLLSIKDKWDPNQVLYGYTAVGGDRWSDNDQYSHMNNSIYYHLFDSIVNTYLIEKCGQSPQISPTIGLVISSWCQFYAPLSFPDVLDLGLRVTKLGNSSVTYEIGVFKSGEDNLSAVGGYTHVFVEREQRKSVSIGVEARDGLERLLTDGSKCAVKGSYKL
ncbi:hypothetical protein V5O48_009213 [Marasmius crinis-equi]|uniref:FAD-binding PCMH-type domain-containing protein n=1 Tax=Marasmius crinis-equi TaxID=585013 RepID=A0ABR3FCE2_9AGAR